MPFGEAPVPLKMLPLLKNWQQPAKVAARCDAWSYCQCKALFIYGIKSTWILCHLQSKMYHQMDGHRLMRFAKMKMVSWRSHGLNLLATKCNCHLLPSSSNNGIAQFSWHRIRSPRTTWLLRTSLQHIVSPLLPHFSNICKNGKNTPVK